jgi:hypothetical protein
MSKKLAPQAGARHLNEAAWTARIPVIPCETPFRCRTGSTWVDDPDTFYQPWSGRLTESCADVDARRSMLEDNQHPFDCGMPMAAEPDF